MSAATRQHDDDQHPEESHPLVVSGDTGLGPEGYKGTSTQAPPNLKDQNRF